MHNKGFTFMKADCSLNRLRFSSVIFVTLEYFVRLYSFEIKMRNIFQLQMQRVVISGIYLMQK